MKLVPAKCPSCGANIEVNENLEKAICQYCGTTVIIQEAVEKYKIEISGEVKVDGIESKKELLKNAEVLAELGKYTEANSKFTEYQQKYPDDYNGYLSELRMFISDGLTKFKPSIIDTMLKYKQKIYTYFEKFAPEDVKNKFDDEFKEFFNSHENDVKRLAPGVMSDIIDWNSNNLKVKSSELTELFKEKYLIDDERINLLNEYYFIDIMRAFNEEKINFFTASLLEHKLVFDMKKFCFYLESDSAFERMKLSGLCKKNVFGKNSPVNDYGAGTLVLDYNIIGVDYEGNLRIAARGGAYYGNVDKKMGTFPNINIRNMSLEEIQSKLSGYEKKAEAARRAEALNKMSFKDAKKKLNLSLPYTDEQFDKFVYVFKDGKVIFGAPRKEQCKNGPQMGRYIYHANRICVLEDKSGIDSL